jgi:predicted trehalose synthase
MSRPSFAGFRRISTLALLLVSLAFTACGTGDGSEDATRELVERVDQVRAAADSRDAVAFGTATTELRSAVASMQQDGRLGEEKAASILRHVDDVEMRFRLVTPTTTATTPSPPTTVAPAPTTAAPTTTAREEDERGDSGDGGKGKAKGKKSEAEDSDS